MKEFIKKVKDDERFYFFLIFGIQIIIYILLFSSGFKALSADEYSRTLKAYYWKESPSFITTGMWLPFGYYVEGLALLIWNNLFWTPRIVTIIFSLFSALSFYYLIKIVFEKRIIAFLSTLIMVVLPWHMWLGAAPLADIYSITFTNISLLLLLTGIRKSKNAYILLGGLSSALATGFRYEAWWFTGVFSLTNIFFAIKLFIKQKRKLSLAHLTSSATSISFILLWMISSFLKTGSFTSFVSDRDAYMGEITSTLWERITYYPKQFLEQPYLIILLISLIGFLLVTINKKLRKKLLTTGMLLYSLFFLIPFLVLIGYNSRSIPPASEASRLITPTVLFLIPFFATCLCQIHIFTRKIFKKVRLPFVPAIILALTIFSTICFETTYSFRYKSVLDEPTRIGLLIGDLNQHNIIKDGERVLIQLHYWDFRGIVVGSNNPELFIFDGPFNPLIELDKKIIPIKKQPDSYFITLSDEELEAFFADNNISWAVLKSDSLKQRLEQFEYVKIFHSYNSWTLYKIESKDNL
jgi:hypothetical protein